MKINLRFILAYMDDILPPADAAEVSRLLKEDPAAEKLMDRIGEVVRKRRLSVPDLLEETEGKDANDVAEYLDNLMSPEQIRQFEQKCLDSDEQLAEVAACHEILTLVLGGKDDVPPSTREKLEQIANSVGYNSDYGEPDYSEPPAGKPIPLSAVEIPVSNLPDRESGPESTVPVTFELPQRDSHWKNKGLIAAIALLVIAWIYSIATDESLRPGNAPNVQQVAQNDQKPSAKAVAIEKKTEPLPDSTTNPPNSKADRDDSSETNNLTKADQQTGQGTLVVTKSPENTAKKSIDPTPTELPKISLDQADKFQPPLENAPKEKSAEEIAMLKQNGNGEMESKSKQVNAKDINPVPAEPKQPVCFTPSIVYVSKDQHLIRQAASQSNAVMVKEMTEVEPGDRLFCLQDMEAEFSIGNGKGNLRVLGNTALELLGADERSCFGIDLARGRIIFSFQPDNADQAPKRVRILVHGVPWYVELPREPGSIAVEVSPQKPTHFEKLPEPAPLVATVWVIGPAVRLSRSGGEWEEIKQAKQLFPYHAPRDEAAEKPDAKELPASLPVPDWAIHSEVVLSPFKSRDQKDFLKKIDGSVNLWLDLEGVANDPNPYIAQIAAQALSLGERYESLVNILVYSPHEESRTAAINGLREWLPQSPKNRDILRNLLDQTVDEQTSSIIYKLLWGFDDQDARDPDISQQLVTWLKHDQAAVRELAIYWISHLTGKKLGYRPLSSLKTREQGATTWQRHLNKIGALLPPEK